MVPEMKMESFEIPQRNFAQRQGRLGDILTTAPVPFSTWHYKAMLIQL